VNNKKPDHIPVLTEALAEQIKLPQDAVMVDATVGQGGHSMLFGHKLGPQGLIIGLDIDKDALPRAQDFLNGLPCRVILLHSNFSQIKEQLNSLGIKKVDLILADLGVSSAQLVDENRGLSFLQDMPLDMRLDKRLKTTAADIINKADEKSIAEIIYRFGEDRASRRIARFIVNCRREKPITTTSRLAQVVSKALYRPGKKKAYRIHPATRTFQALRIAVNNELENLDKLLKAAPELLNKDGYIAVISFHSLEDRLVKNSFKENQKLGIYKILTKKPVRPTKNQIKENKRSRSAKLRIAQRA
jgi:16S rRNA (cytosine1402-N4)-methyltransferase